MNWLNNLFQSATEGLAKNPVGSMLRMLISKWYLIIVLSGSVTTYWALRALYDLGVVHKAEQIVSDALLDSQAIAQHCMPKLGNPKKFWQCVEKHPPYRPSPEDAKVKSFLNKALKKQRSEPTEYPYRED